MRLLVDAEIQAALQHPCTTALAYAAEGKSLHVEVDANQVRSSSLELTIGQIFIPGSAENDWGGTKNPKYEHHLGQGRTAVIVTRERLRMGPSRAAIAFPPAHVSLKGLLMTNPGLIDPGYEGPLHCTVINMGHETYPLISGERIMRALIFQLDTEDQKRPLADRLPAKPPSSPITTELLSRLSTDFVDVEKRAKTIAEQAISAATWRATLIAAVGPILFAIVGLGITIFSPWQGLRNDITKLQADVIAAATKLDEKQDIHALDVRLATMKEKFDRQGSLDQRLRAVEDRLNHQ